MSMMIEGHCVSRLAVHFGVIMDVVLDHLEVELAELPVIDLE